MLLYNISILYLYACSMAQVISILSAYHKEIWCNSNILDLNSVGGTLFKLCPVHHLTFLRLFMVSSFCQGKYPFMIIFPSQCHIISAVERDPLNNIVIHHTNCDKFMNTVMFSYRNVHSCKRFGVLEAVNVKISVF